MSGWNAPTGSWDSGQEPGPPGRPDEQDYQQGEPAGSYRTVPGGEGSRRPGRRSLPGYDEAQGYDQGPSPGRPPGYGLPAVAQAQFLGAATSPRHEPGAFGSYPPDPGRSGPQDPLGSGPWLPAARPQAAPGPGPYEVAGRDEAAAGTYRGYNAAPGWPDAGEAQDYAPGPGYGSPPGYGQQGAGPAGPAGFPPRPGPDYRTEAYPQPGSDPPGYPQDEFRRNGSGGSGYGQGGGPGFGPDSYGEHAYGPSAVMQDSYGRQDYEAPPGYGQDRFPPDGFDQAGYDQAGYDQAGYDQPGYDQPGFDQARFDQPGFDQPGFDQARFDQPGFGPPGATGYDYDDLSLDGREAAGSSGPPREGQRSPQRPGGLRMALYLAASVLGVVVIVFLVVTLTKSGSGSSPGASSTPSSGTGPAAAPGAAAAYVIRLPGGVGPYPLDPQAAAAVAATVKGQSGAVAASLAAGGFGRASKTVIGVYDLGPVTSVAASEYKGIYVVGYDGTFSPAKAIRVIRAHLVSPRAVHAGPHGGKMVCGYDTSSGADASECVWVTTSTLGAVQFVEHGATVKYPRAATLALRVRDAVEVPAQ